MPKGWVETSIGQVLNIQQGKTLAVGKLSGGKYPVYGANGIVGHFDDYNFDYPVTGLGCRGSCGTIYYIQERAFLANNVMAIWQKDSTIVLPKFIPLALETMDLVTTGAISGQVQPQITKQSLESVPISIPPLDDQKRIVDLVSSVDSYIESLQRQLENAKKSRNAVLHKIFHIDLNDWALKTLEECTLKISDGSHNPPKGIDASEFLMLSSKDVWDGYLTNNDPRYLSESDYILERRRTALDAGDVLLTIVGTIGRCAVYEGQPRNITFQRSVCVIKPNKSILNATFLMLFLQSIQRHLDQEARGVAQRGIYLNQIRKLQVPTPPISEQLKVTEAIGTFDSVIKVCERLICETKSLRSGLLSDLFSGQHEIPDSYDKVMDVA
jgi:type I restriction enzyme S subunit